MADRYPGNLTTQFSAGAFLNTLNPVSRIFGWEDDTKRSRQWVPQWAIKQAQKLGLDKTKAAKMGHVFTKVIGGGAVIGGLVALLRLGAHYADMDKINIAGHTAGQKLKKQYQRQTDPLLQPQNDPIGQDSVQAPTQKQPDAVADLQQNPTVAKNAAWDPYAVANATIPPAVALLAAMAAYSSTDKLADKLQAKKLNKEIDSTLADINTIGLNNIRTVRGVKNQPQQQPAEEPVVKNASGQLSSAVGLITLLLAAGSGTIGFQLQRAYDPNTIKYKALKKGIQEYNKIRSTERLFKAQPINKDLLQTLDPQPKQGKAAIDQLPEVNTESMYRPVDI